jgi:phosphoadenosine phosphosulfate reductase
MLQTQTLFEHIDLVQLAIDRLRSMAPKNEPYYGAFSGGKDSQCIKEIARMAGVDVEWHYNWTTVDPPEVLAYIKANHPDVTIHKPEMTMWQLIVKKRYPPTRMVRYCCEILKEGGGSGRRVITGVRWAESSKRSKRRMVETCFKDATKTYVNPIIDWTDSDVWEFIRGNNLPYCSLYDEGFTRLGCIMCPMSGKNMQKEADRWPKIAAAYRRACGHALAKRIADGLPTKWTHGDEMFDWWMRGGDGKKDDPDQTIMFE